MVLLGLDAIVVSALVFDGDKILLVRDDERQPPWLVPPSTRVGCFMLLRRPHQAVIRTVRSETGIDIEMPAYPMGVATTPMAHPYFTQSEKQWWERVMTLIMTFIMSGTLASAKNIRSQGNVRLICGRGFGSLTRSGDSS